MAGRTNASALVRVRVAALARVSPSIAVRVGALALPDPRSDMRRLARHHRGFYRRGGLALEFVTDARGVGHHAGAQGLLPGTFLPSAVVTLGSKSVDRT